MNRLIISLFLLLIFLFFFVFFRSPVLALTDHYLYYSKCDSPIHYSIGRVDSQFNISRNQVSQDTQQATQIWDHVFQKQLFVYDPQGSLSVNLVYDSRQFLQNQIGSIEQKLKDQQSQLGPQIQRYEAQVQDLKNRIAQLNSQIESWNSKGGAPPDVYKNLIQQQQELQNEASALNQKAKELNQSTIDYNIGVGQLNQTIDTFNAQLQEKPEEGIFNPQDNTITIYFDTSQREFVHTLAHELGHSLGLEHTSLKGSIMYPRTNDSITPSVADIAQLASVCKKQNILLVDLRNVTDIINYYKTHVLQK